MRNFNWTKFFVSSLLIASQLINSFAWAVGSVDENWDAYHPTVWQQNNPETQSFFPQQGVQPIEGAQVEDDFVNSFINFPVSSPTPAALQFLPVGIPQAESVIHPVPTIKPSVPVSLEQELFTTQYVVVAEEGMSSWVPLLSSDIKSGLDPVPNESFKKPSRKKPFNWDPYKQLVEESFQWSQRKATDYIWPHLTPEHQVHFENNSKAGSSFDQWVRDQRKKLIKDASKKTPGKKPVNWDSYKQLVEESFEWPLANARDYIWPQLTPEHQEHFKNNSKAGSSFDQWVKDQRKKLIKNAEPGSIASTKKPSRKKTFNWDPYKQLLEESLPWPLDKAREHIWPQLTPEDQVYFENNSKAGSSFDKMLQHRRGLLKEKTTAGSVASTKKTRRTEQFNWYPYNQLMEESIQWPLANARDYIWSQLTPEDQVYFENDSDSGSLFDQSVLNKRNYLRRKASQSKRKGPEASSAPIFSEVALDDGSDIHQAKRLKIKPLDESSINFLDTLAGTNEPLLILQEDPMVVDTDGPL